MTDTKIIDAINLAQGKNITHGGGCLWRNKVSGRFGFADPCGQQYSGQTLSHHYWSKVCTVEEYNQCVEEMSEGLFVPLSDYHKSNILVPETSPFNADTQSLHAVSVDLFNVGDTVYDLTGKPTTVQSDATIGKYTVGKLCGGNAQLYTTCFSSAEHFQRHEEASELADYISRKLEWGVVPEGVTLADLQTIKSIIDNGVE